MIQFNRLFSSIIHSKKTYNGNYLALSIFLSAAARHRYMNKLFLGCFVYSRWLTLRLGNPYHMIIIEYER